MKNVNSSFFFLCKTCNWNKVFFEEEEGFVKKILPFKELQQGLILLHSKGMKWRLRCATSSFWEFSKQIAHLYLCSFFSFKHIFASVGKRLLHSRQGTKCSLLSAKNSLWLGKDWLHRLQNSSQILTMNFFNDQMQFEQNFSSSIAPEEIYLKYEKV